MLYKGIAFSLSISLVVAYLSDLFLYDAKYTGVLALLHFFINSIMLVLVPTVQAVALW